MKKQQQSLNLFEANAPPTREERQEAAIKAFVPKVENPCPKCGTHSQATAHPRDHEGHTQYCIVCAKDGEPYYFTPGESQC